MTVQQVLDEALSTILRTKIKTVGAGRTDTGVHARQMFAHFDMHPAGGAGPIDDLQDLTYRLNSLLPAAIAVQHIYMVSDDAHARFDAVQRSYEYWVVQRKNPFYSDVAHYVKHPLDVSKMNDATAILLNHDNFECFSKSHTDVKTYLCNIKKAVWERHEEKLVFTISADRFLRNMVRAIVGTLLQVGLGNWTFADVKRIINSGDRSQAGPSVPAKGLYLTSVLYPPKILKKHG